MKSLQKIQNKLSKPDIKKVSRSELNEYVLRMHEDIKRLERHYESKVDAMSRRIDRRDKLIKGLRYMNFVNQRRLYAQKLRMSKEKTEAKRSVYKRAVNNIVSKNRELIDIPKYHMALFEVSKIFDKPEMFIVLLLWASRYEYYSKKEFMSNFKNSPLKFEKYNMMLVREGYANKWEQKRYSYFISAKGKELVDKINKFVQKRMNG